MGSPVLGISRLGWRGLHATPTELIAPPLTSKAPLPTHQTLGIRNTIVSLYFFKMVGLWRDLIYLLCALRRLRITLQHTNAHHIFQVTDN
jgi:hypothetical protein